MSLRVRTSVQEAGSSAAKRAIRAGGIALTAVVPFLAGTILAASFSHEAAAQGRRLQPQQDTRSMVRVVRSGETSRIWFGYALTPECEVLRGWNVTIERLPKHGEVSLQRTEARITPGWLRRDHMNPRQMRNARACMGRDTLVITLHYRSRQGYGGPDDLRIVVTSANKLLARTIEMSLQVR